MSIVSITDRERELSCVIADLKAENTKLREAAKLGLEALESCTPGDYSTGSVIHPSFDEQAVDKAITTLKEALGAK